MLERGFGGGVRRHAIALVWGITGFVGCSDPTSSTRADTTGTVDTPSTLATPSNGTTSNTGTGTPDTAASTAPSATSHPTNTTQPATPTSSPDSTSDVTAEPAPSTSDASSDPELTGDHTTGASNPPPATASTGDVSETVTTDAPSPPVDLPDGLVDMFPLPDASAVCPDPTLHLTFAGKPSLGAQGKISVYDATQPGSPVATVDLSKSTVSDSLGGSTFTVAKPAYVDGNEVIFGLPARGLGYGKTFYVTIDAGAIKAPNGESFTISDDRTWRFTTFDVAPADKSALRVALDGDGQYCTLQSAVDAAQEGTTISMGVGNYYGLVYFKNKTGLTIHGEDRERTAIKGINNNNLNPSTRGRALVGSESVKGLTLENLTIQNLTPQDGSQAEALVLLKCDQCVVRDANILSLQDTLLWSGRIYAEDCYVAGNVDYIWGEGTVYFNRCEFRTVGRKGYNVQARNGASAHGYVFVDSKLTADDGITGDILARIDVSAYPNSEVAYIDCEMGPHISAAGWLISGGNAPSSLRFLEYKSKTPTGALVDTSNRLTGSRQLSDNDAATYRDPAQILGGWSPPVR